MVDLYDIRAYTDICRPRRIMKYVLVYCSAGTIELAVDDDHFVMTPNSVITITSGQIHAISKLEEAAGQVLEFSYDFFCKSDHDIELVFHNSLFCHFGQNEVITLHNSQVPARQLECIAAELATKPYQYLITVHSRMELLLVEINRQKIANGGEIWKPDALFLKFLETVRNNFAQQPNTRMAAELLSTSQAKLNEHAKLHTGKTAQNVIYGLVASEAKRLFKYDNLSVKEVAFALGFSDPFYFSRFFKKQTGMAPREYMERYAD
jgi:AraC-like DNA-binding protein